MIERWKARYAVFDSLPLGICVIDARWIVRCWNSTMELWTGHPRELLLRTPLVDLYPALAGAYYAERLKGVLQGGPPVYFSSRLHRNLFPSRLPNGASRSFNVTITALPPEEGGETLALISLLDVTDHEAGMEKLRGEKVKVARQLEQSIRLQEELARKKELAEQAVTMKSRFLANMSHEIRTPLSGVLGLIMLLEKTHLDPTQRSYLEMLTASGNALHGLVNDILDLARLEAEKRAVRLQETDLRKLAADLRGVFMPQAAEKGLALSIEIEPAVPPPVVTDPDAVFQIAMNLLSNSVKFTQRGSVRAVLSVNGGTAGKTGPEVLAIRVQDSGIGIPEERINDIFESFTQLEDPLTKRARGTGLGLAIVKGLVELLRGTVQVHSRPGRGSTFTVRIPVYLAASARTEAGVPEAGLAGGPPDAPAGPAPGGREAAATLLVVEDNPMNLVYLQTVLSAQGYRVIAAADGREALETLSRQAVDAALIDLQIPGLNGFDLARRVRTGQAGGRRDLPLLAVTGFALEETRARCLKEGFQGFITKPINEKGLLRAVREALQT